MASPLPEIVCQSMLDRTWGRIADALRRDWSPSARTAVCAGIAFAFVALLSASGALQSLERMSLDVRFQYANRPATVDTSVVLAAIDDPSISFVRDQMEVGWPWPREYYALLVDYFDEGGAHSVIFDILFSEPDFPRTTVNAEQSDARFATAMEEAGNVALAVQLTEGDTTDNPIASEHGFSEPLGGHVRVPHYQGAVAPIPSFQSAAARLGGVNVVADGDGVVRRLPVAYRIGEEMSIPNLGAAGLLASRPREETAEGLLSRVPVDESGQFLLYWYGPGGVEGAFEDQYVSIRSLIVSAARVQLGEPPIVPPERFEGKTVLVGGLGAGLHDQHATPVSGEGDYPGMEILATFVSNAQQGDFLWDGTGAWSYLLVFLLTTIGAGLVAVRPGRVGLAAGAAAGLGLVYLVGVVATFYVFLWWLPVVAPLLGLAAGFSITSMVNYAVEGRRRRQLRDTFQRYVSPQVVDEVVQNPEAIELGGKEVEATVYFSDIQGFTSVAEQLSPREVVQRLNEYFGVATDVVLDHRAMVDKYIGDAIMAVFGAPVQDPDHASQACLAALEMDRILSEYYDHFDNGDRPPFRSRIGIHTGSIVVGNVGTEQRIDYTAIGDAVNVAARLEQANKQYNTRILVSEATYAKAEEAVEAREIDLLRLTGKEHPIRIFEVLAPVGHLSDEQERLRATFAEGLEAYRARRWTRARQAFAEILRADPEDGPASVYQQRVEERAGESLPASWKGIHEMKTGK